MNMGDVMFEIAQAMLRLGMSFSEFLTSKIDISFITKTLDLFNITTNLPNEISAITFIGGVSGLTILALVIYRIIRG